jgi:hypothetical protein
MRASVTAATTATTKPTKFKLKKVKLIAIKHLNIGVCPSWM